MDINAYVTSGKDLSYKLPWAKGKEDVWVAYIGDDGGAPTDIFLHFHGFLPAPLLNKDPLTILNHKTEGKVRRSGMQDRKTGGALSLPGKNALMIIPCGQAKGNVMKFDGLDVPALVEACQAWYDDQAQQSSQRDAKLTCTAHSGGGAALNLIAVGKLGGPDVDALHYYDATYNAEPKLQAWAKSGKLCVSYIDGSGTAAFAKVVEGWKPSKFRSAKAVGGVIHDDVPYYSFPYFLTGKTYDAKKMDPSTCSPL